MARGHDVKRQAHQFEAEIERDQVGGRDQHQHAERREQDQHGIFEPLLVLALLVIERHQRSRRPSRAAPGFSKTGRNRRPRSCRRMSSACRPATADRVTPAIDQQRNGGESRRAPAGRSLRKTPSIRSAMAPTPRTSSGSSGTSRARSRGVHSPYLVSAAVCTRADRMMVIVDQARHRDRGHVEHRLRIDAEHDGQDHQRRQNRHLAPADILDVEQAGLLQLAEDHLAVEP